MLQTHCGRRRGSTTLSINESTIRGWGPGEEWVQKYARVPPTESSDFTQIWCDRHGVRVSPFMISPHLTPLYTVALALMLPCWCWCRCCCGVSGPQCQSPDWGGCMIDSVSLLFLARAFLFSGVFWLGKNLGRRHEERLPASFMCCWCIRRGTPGG